MSDSETQDAAPADPVSGMIKALAEEKESAAKKSARREFSGIAAAAIWEQLPSMLKSAARGDARRLVGQSRGEIDLLVDAGYGRRAARNLLADIGRA